MFYLSKPGILCTLANSAESLGEALVQQGQREPLAEKLFSRRKALWVGEIHAPLMSLAEKFPDFNCRNNQLAAAALDQIKPCVGAAIRRYGSSRVAVCMGTSTTGIAQTEKAVRQYTNTLQYPDSYHAIQGTLCGLGEFVAAYLGTTGYVTTISTACSSSANAILSARRLLKSGLCDAVVVGGVDSLCEMTLQGFSSLEATSEKFCRPFCADRDGINLGEAAAIFVLSKEPGEVAFLGGAATSDAHHISAPHPDGEGAYQAMLKALEDANISPEDIDYLNLHGTGTKQNDSMESLAVNRLFAQKTPCSSSKSMTGHTLGASGALELAICWLLLSQASGWRLPPHLYTKQRDHTLAPIAFTDQVNSTTRRPQYCLSNSFAFGGSNVSLLIGRNDA